MSKKLISVFCLTALMVLVLSSVASSQCGWVLWEKREYPKKEYTTWEIIDGYPDHDQCVRAREKVWKARREEAIKDKEKDSAIPKIEEVPHLQITEV